jgi:glycerophosphoryl diester phosphodiesterase
MNHKLVVAHAGGRSDAAPNTLDAFDHAISLGVDMIECDVRRTAEGELVVHHDEAISGRLLSAMDYATSARRAREAGYELPRFRDLLALAANRVRLDVELKEVGSEREVLRLLGEHGWRPEAFVVTSFELAAIAAVTAADAQVRTGLLVYDVTGAQALQLFRESGAAFLAPDHLVLDAPTLREARLHDIELLPWTVNDPAVMRDLLREAAVVGVITDDVVTALDIRDRQDRRD